MTSNGTPATEGSISFTLLDSNGNTVGTTTSGSVSNNGIASVSYTLPGGTAAGSYTIEASYSDLFGDYDSSSDDTHTLTVNAAAVTSLSLNTVRIVPNVSNSTAQVTLTARVSNPAGVVNEGVVSFTLAGKTEQARVVNGTATVQLTVPLKDVMQTSNVTLSYSDATTGNFANGRASITLSVNVWNAMLPSNLTFANGNEQIEVQLAGQSLFGYEYSSSGLLTQIDVASLAMPVTYTQVAAGDVLVTIDGMPWQWNFINSAGQSQGMETLALTSDGSAEWIVYNSAGQIIGAQPV